MSGNDVAHLIEDIDGYLCELGTAQIRDGLHVLGAMPPLPDTLRALTRLPNGQVPGLQAALASAFGFDLEALLAAPGARLDREHDVAGRLLPDARRRASSGSKSLAHDLFIALEHDRLPGAVDRGDRGIDGSGGRVRRRLRRCALPAARWCPRSSR